MDSGKIRSFTDLVAWQNGHKLALYIYQLTKKFPKDELFGIINQLRRAAVSITSNIAEGFSRQSVKEKMQFFFTALGSLTEVQNQLLIAKDLGYITKPEFSQAADQTIEVSKLINGLIKKCKIFASHT